MENVLRDTITRMCVPKKGILAADESTNTVGKRLASIGVENTFENRVVYRQLLFTSPDIEQYICGVITYEETLLTTIGDGSKLIQPLLDRGILVGIKTDQGYEGLRDANDTEKHTKGMDTLRERSTKYFEAGARFAKWRCVFNVGASRLARMQNAVTLARYAKISQECGLVPIIEPEVLMDGDHTEKKCMKTTWKVLNSVFEACKTYKVNLDLAILKPNFVCASKQLMESDGYNVGDKQIKRFVRKTVKVLEDICEDYPIKGIFFLSGGLTDEMSQTMLDRVVKKSADEDDMPDKISFSFGRALQRAVLDEWKGLDENKEAAQTRLLERCKTCSDVSA